MSEPSPLNNDPAFLKLAGAFSSRSPAAGLDPLVGTLGSLERFVAVRRREVRAVRLERAGRGDAAELGPRRESTALAVGAFRATVENLIAQAKALEPLITPHLDEVIALAADESHPLRGLLGDTARSLGFAREEAAWLFEELKRIEFRPVRLVCAEGFEDLLALLEGVSVGEAGLLLAGFLRFTGDSETDERIEKLVLRLRAEGVTANLFLALVIVVAAHAVASQK